MRSYLTSHATHSPHCKPLLSVFATQKGQPADAPRFPSGNKSNSCSPEVSSQSQIIQACFPPQNSLNHPSVGISGTEKCNNGDSCSSSESSSEISESTGGDLCSTPIVRISEITTQKSHRRKPRALDPFFRHEFGVPLP